MSVNSEKNYYINPKALSFTPNYQGFRNIVYVSVVSNAAIKVYHSAVDGLGYGMDAEYQTWRLSAATTSLGSSSAYFIYARLSRTQQTADIIFSVRDYSIEGTYKYIDEDGEEQETDPSDTYYYIKIGSLTETDAAGEDATVNRVLTYVSGELGTDKQINEKSDSVFEQMFEFVSDAVGKLIKVKKAFLSIEVSQESLFRGLATFFQGFKFGDNGKVLSNVATSEDTLNPDDHTLPTTGYVAKEIESLDDHFLIKDDPDNNQFVAGPVTFEQDVTVEGNHAVDGNQTIGGNQTVQGTQEVIGLQTLHEGFKTSNFDALGGHIEGAQLTSAGVLTASGIVTMSFKTWELIYNVIRAQGGKTVLSNAATVDRVQFKLKGRDTLVDTYDGDTGNIDYVLLTLKKDEHNKGANPFKAGDILYGSVNSIGASGDVAEGGECTMHVIEEPNNMTVKAQLYPVNAAVDAGYDTVSSNIAPTANMTIAQRGNVTNVERRTAIFLDGEAMQIVMLQGVNTPRIQKGNYGNIIGVLPPALYGDIQKVFAGIKENDPVVYAEYGIFKNFIRYDHQGNYLQAENNRGEWDAKTTYENNASYYDVVTYRGQLWKCIQENRGFAPQQGEYWLLLVAKGERGNDGTSIKVSGSYADVTSFEAVWKNTDGSWKAPSDPSTCYVVGLDLYVWVEDESRWMNAGQFKGDKGESPYIADTNNEMDSVPLDVNGIPTSLTPIECLVWMNHGTEKVVLSSVTANSITGFTKKEDLNNNKTECTVKFTPLSTSAIAEKNTSTITLKALDDNGNTITRYLVITINGVKPGAAGKDAKIYRLLPSANQIVKHEDGTYTPYTIKCGCTLTEGDTVTENPSRVYGYYTTDGTNYHRFYSTSAISTNGVSSIKFELRDSTGTSYKVLDSETVSVVSDGKEGPQGANSIKLDLSNQFDSIIYTDGGVKISGDVSSVARLYDGGKDKTGDAALSLGQQDGCTAKLNGHTITVSALSKNSAHVEVKAMYNGTTYTAVFSIVKLINEDKYELVCTPNALSYNTTTGVWSSENITVEVYKSSIDANGSIIKSKMDELDTGFGIYVYKDGYSNDSSLSYQGGKGSIDIKIEGAVKEYEIKLVRGDKLHDIETIPVNMIENGSNGLNAANYICEPSNINVLVDANTNEVLTEITQNIYVYAVRNGEKLSTQNYDVSADFKTSGDGEVKLNGPLGINNNRHRFQIQIQEGASVNNIPSRIKFSYSDYNKGVSYLSINISQRGIVGEAGKAGPQIIPSGYLLFEQAYNLTYAEDGVTVTHRPLVYYEGDKNYYLLKTDVSASDNILANLATYWEVVTNYGPVFTDVLMAQWSKLAQAIFWGNYMFSQKGVVGDKVDLGNNKLEDVDFSYFKDDMFENIGTVGDEDWMITDKFIPHLFLDLKRGLMKTNKLSETFREFRYRSEDNLDVDVSDESKIPLITPVDIIDLNDGYNVKIDTRGLKKVENPGTLGESSRESIPVLCMPQFERITDLNGNDIIDPDGKKMYQPKPWEPDGMHVSVLVRATKEWTITAENAANNVLRTFGTGLKPIYFYPFLKEGVILLSDPRVLEQASYKSGSTGKTFKPDNEYNENTSLKNEEPKNGGFFVVNGHLTKVLIVEPGTIVKFRSCYSKYKGSGNDDKEVLMWYVENSDIFDFVDVKVGVRHKHYYNATSGKVIPSSIIFQYDFGYYSVGTQGEETELRDKVFATKTFVKIRELVAKQASGWQESDSGVLFTSRADSYKANIREDVLSVSLVQGSNVNYAPQLSAQEEMHTENQQ